MALKLNFKQFLDVLGTVAPVILMAVPGGAAIAPIVPVIIAGIKEAEQIPSASGPEKKAHVMGLVSDAVKAANIVRPGSLDETEALATADNAVDAVVGTVNLVKGFGPEEETSTAPPSSGRKVNTATS